MIIYSNWGAASRLRFCGFNKEMLLTRENRSKIKAHLHCLKVFYCLSVLLYIYLFIYSRASNREKSFCSLSRLSPGNTLKSDQRVLRLNQPLRLATASFNDDRERLQLALRFLQKITYQAISTQH